MSMLKSWPEKEVCMKKIAISVLIFWMFVFGAETFARPVIKESGGGGHRPDCGSMYDPKAVETITGSVEKVDKITSGNGRPYGVHLKVRTHKGSVDVHLGQNWRIENKDIRIMPGDKVGIKGSRITFQSKPVIIAAEVRNGDEVLQLRDGNGFLVWAGWRRR
jgi:hypothetical protein